MRKNKLLAFMCAFTMLASSFGAMSVNVFANEEIQDPPAAEEEATPAPPDPLTPLTVTALPKDRTVTFDAGYVDETKTTYTIPDVFGEYVAVYAGEYDGGARNIEIDGSNKTFDDTRRYTTRIKLGGSVVLDENGAPAIRTISVTPAEDGVLVIDFAHASSSGDARTLAAYQSGEIIGTALAEADNQNTLAVEVEANEPVYIYSQNSGINIYGIYLTDSYTHPTEPEPPADIQVTPLPLGANISFADSGLTDRQQITESTVLAGGYVAAYATSSRYLEARNSNQTIDGVSYTMAIRTNGGATVGSDGIPTDRAIMVTPEEAGLLKVPFRHGSGTDDVRDLIAVQNGEIIGTEDVVGDNNAVLQVRVAADAPVYIYSTGNVNIYGVKLEEVIEPTPLPAGTRVTFDAGYNADTKTGTEFNTTTVFDNYTVVYASADATVSIEARNRTVGGYRYTTAVRMNSAQPSGVIVPTARAISVTPAVADKLTVDFGNPSGEGEPRPLILVQNGQEIARGTVNAGSEATVTADVQANSPVYIYSTDGVNVYGILLGEEGGTVTPPAEDDKEITKLTATYDANDVLQSVSIETIKASEAGDPVLEGTERVFYWESLESMKPYTGDENGEDQPSSPELEAVNEARTWTFSQEEYAQYGTSTTDGEGNVTVSISTDIVNNGLKIVGSDGAIDIDNSNKTFDGERYTQRLKLGGIGDPTKRAVSFLPGMDGTLKICAVSSNSEEKVLTVEGAQPSTCTIGSEEISQTVDVTGGTPVTIYGNGGVNIYALIYTPAE